MLPPLRKLADWDSPMTPEQIASDIINAYLGKKGATIECDLFVPIVAAIRAARGCDHFPAARVWQEFTFCKKCGTILKREDGKYVAYNPLAPNQIKSD